MSLNPQYRHDGTLVHTPNNSTTSVSSVWDDVVKASQESLSHSAIRCQNDAGEFQGIVVYEENRNDVTYGCSIRVLSVEEAIVASGQDDKLKYLNVDGSRLTWKEVEPEQPLRGSFLVTNKRTVASKTIFVGVSSGWHYGMVLLNNGSKVLVCHGETNTRTPVKVLCFA